MSDVVDRTRQVFGIPARQRGQGSNPHAYPRPSPHVSPDQYAQLHSESLSDSDAFWARVRLDPLHPGRCISALCAHAVVPSF